MDIFRGDEEIYAILNACAEREDEGGSRFPGKTYEEGLSAMARWITGESDNHPYEDE